VKKGNYNKIGNLGKKIFAVILLFSLLFITLLRSQILSHKNLAFDSTPPAAERCRADNTQHRRTFVFAMPAGRFSPAGLQADNNPLTTGVYKIIQKEELSTHELSGRAGRSGIIISPKQAGGPVEPDAAIHRPENYEWLDGLLDKIWTVESGRQLCPPDGDGGQAVGPLQIHCCVLEDVNMRYGTKFTRSDLREIKTARLIAQLYIRLWMNIYKEEIAARIFNGGPRGWRKKSTDAYWVKIQKAQ